MNRVILWREKDEPRTNVEFRKGLGKERCGYEWGYGGKEPLELAFNILLYYVLESDALRLCDGFKEKFIKPMPFDGGIIEENEILNYIEWNMVEV